MEVILLEKIRKLGALGEKVNVKPGFGRNYLIPQRKAVFATPTNLAKFEARRAELEKIEADRLAVAQARSVTLKGIGVVTIACRAGEDGKLFGSVGTRDIAEAITKAGVAIDKSEVHLPEGTLRNIGEYDIGIDLHGDIDIEVKVILAVA